MAAKSSYALTHDNSFVKASTLKAVPSHFTYPSVLDFLPTVDFSMLISGDLDQQASVLQDLDKACEEWGFFVLINHGIPESVLKGILDATMEFFELPEKEKRQYETASDPIKYGSGSATNHANNIVNFWRDNVKCYVHS